MNTAESTRARTIGGRYTLSSPMGSFGVGTVWRARDQRRDQDVAIQEVVMPPGASTAERQMLSARSMSEAQTAAMLRHPSVVPICDAVMDGERPWIVMEFLTARSLEEIVRDDGPLPFAVVADIGLHLLGALDAAHRAGILHRDVKPGNILIGKGSWAALAGFGVARTSGDSAMTSAGLALCSPPYIPPERARGDEPTAASDLWSLGAALFTAVEGRPPFDAGDPMPTLAAILAEPPARMRRAGPLAPVLAGLLERDPKRRWGLERARAGLRAVLLGSDPQAPPRARSPSGRAHPRSHGAPERRGGRPLIAGAAGASVLIIAILAGVFFTSAAQSDKAARVAQVMPSASRSLASTFGPSSVSVPTAYVRYQHRLGFSLDVPQEWSKEERPNGDVLFRDPPYGRILAVQRVANAATSIRDYWDAGDAGERTRPGYELLGIRAARLGQYPGADWEFLRRQGTGLAAMTHHALGRGIVVDSTAYIVYLSTQQQDFMASIAVLDRVTASFELSR